MNKNPAQFDVQKLEAINGDKIRALDPAGFVARITPFLERAGLVSTPPSPAGAALIEAAAPLIQTRISRRTEAVGMLSFLFAGDQGGFKVEPEDAERVLTPEALPALRAAEEALAATEPWTHETIEAALKTALVDDLGLKPRVAFAPVRVAVTGKRVSPPLYESIELLGRERTLHRLAAAIKSIG